MAQCHKRAFVTHLIHMDHSGADQKPVRRPSRSGATAGQAGRIQRPSVSDLPPTRFTLAPPLTQHTDSDVTPNVLNVYRLSAINDVGSNVVNITSRQSSNDPSPPDGGSEDGSPRPVGRHLEPHGGWVRCAPSGLR